MEPTREKQQRGNEEKPCNELYISSVRFDQREKATCQAVGSACGFMPVLFMKPPEGLSQTALPKHLPVHRAVLPDYLRKS
jgi:hypothetical protein